MIKSPVVCCSPNLQPTAIVDLMTKVDMRLTPQPEAATTKISMNSRRRLKYWATIRVDVSLVRPTPMPEIKAVL